MHAIKNLTIRLTACGKASTRLQESKAYLMTDQFALGPRADQLPKVADGIEVLLMQHISL